DRSGTARHRGGDGALESRRRGPGLPIVPRVRGGGGRGGGDRGLGGGRSSCARGDGGGALPGGARNPPARLQRQRPGTSAHAPGGDRGRRRLLGRGPAGDRLRGSGGRRSVDRRRRSVRRLRARAPLRATRCASTLTRRLREGTESAG